MKVILVNGSPRDKGCTHEALYEIQRTLAVCGIDAEEFWIDLEPIYGCVNCTFCQQAGFCYVDDVVNKFTKMAKTADGFIFGSPVHFAAASGGLTSFMDRAFRSRGHVFAGKPAAAIVSCRRGGATAALDQLNKYFAICGMPIVPSQYWNMVHGNTPAEVREDKEGMQTMRTLGRNMAWLLKCIELGKENGVPYPELEPPVKTNFIREPIQP